MIVAPPLRRLTLCAALAALVVACATPSGASAPPGPDLAAARAALDASEFERAARLAAPLASASPEAARLLARARLGLAADLAVSSGPDTLRAALDQVELGLLVAPADPALRAELLVGETLLVARMAVAGQGPVAASEVPPPLEVSAETVASATTEAASTAPTSAPPPRRRPTVVPASVFAVAQRKSFDGSGASGQFASCIDIQVLGRGGPVAGAVIGINNGEHSYQDQTDQSGYAGRCGLGASTWSVVLFWTPGGGSGRELATTVYVSGASEQRAAIVFQER